MKGLIMKGLVAAGLVTLVLSGCNSFKSEEEIGLRKTSLYSEKQVKPVYGDFNAKGAGQSKVIARSYENAPPMIPHSTEGMLPITKDNNSCTSCHEPAVAPSLGATPMPKSHFVNYRDDKPKEAMAMYNGRFNCTQCHAPQANVAPLVENDFQGGFKGSTEFKSNFAEVYNEGIE